MAPGESLIAITGATGNTGRVIAERLLAAGEEVRVLGRDTERLQPLIDLGGEARLGLADDARWLTEVFRGVRAVYAMTPPGGAEADVRGFQDRVGGAIAEAVAAAGVPYVVHLSSIGAQLAEGAGPVSGLHAQEERLSAIDGAHVLHLRPGLFMENLYMSAATIQTAGMIASPLRADLSFPWIATVDVAELASKALRATWQGKVTRELHGERDLTFPEVAHVVGTALGRPDIQYVETSLDEAQKSLLRTGMTPDMARCILEMYHALNEGRMVPLEERSKGNTTPTSIERFVQTFVQAF